jgi:hypothetical protein
VPRTRTVPSAHAGEAAKAKAKLTAPSVLSISLCILYSLDVSAAGNGRGDRVRPDFILQFLDKEVGLFHGSWESDVSGAR